MHERAPRENGDRLRWAGPSVERSDGLTDVRVFVMRRAMRKDPVRAGSKYGSKLATLGRR